MASIGQGPATAVASSKGGISLPNTGNTGVFTSISTSGMPLTLGGNTTGNSSFSAASTSGLLGSVLQTSISGTSAPVLNPTNTLNPNKTQISGIGLQSGGFLLNTSGIGGSSASVKATAVTTTTTNTTTTTTTTTTTQESGTLQGHSSGGKGLRDKKYTYRELQELVTNWTSELEENEKLFLKQAQLMSDWDKTLTQNAEDIISIHSDLDSVKSDQSKLEKELDLILAQQKDIEGLLHPLEEQASNHQLSGHQKADIERERIYVLAESLDQQMQQMEQSLGEIIEHINTASAERNPNAPITHIARILNAHASSLQWIERNAGILGRQLERLEI